MILLVFVSNFIFTWIIPTACVASESQAVQNKTNANNSTKESQDQDDMTVAHLAILGLQEKTLLAHLPEAQSR